MNRIFLKKLKTIILISALALLVGYLGINVFNEFDIWSINYWVNIYTQNINSTNLNPAFKAAYIYDVNYTAQKYLQEVLFPNLPITLPQFIGIELLLAGLYFVLDYISKQYNDE
jgi:hypothetical protein